jgi:PPOX class probable F420-dependent enzyme
VDEINRLSSGKYVLLTTFRKDGRAVPTAVWAAKDGDALVVWTVADSGKVKRIRRSGEVRLAPCTARGVATGDEVPGHAELLDAAGTERARGLLAGKYGLVGRVAMLGSRLRRGADGTVGIRVTVGAGDTATIDPAT